jgi:hypothetical protein
LSNPQTPFRTPSPLLTPFLDPTNPISTPPDAFSTPRPLFRTPRMLFQTTRPTNTSFRALAPTITSFRATTTNTTTPTTSFRAPSARLPAPRFEPLARACQHLVSSHRHHQHRVLSPYHPPASRFRLTDTPFHTPAPYQRFQNARTSNRMCVSPFIFIFITRNVCTSSCTHFFSHLLIQHITNM